MILVVAAVAAAIAFGVTYLLGNSSNKTSPPPAAVPAQLQTPSSVQGPSHVQITAVGASAAVPGLKAKPAPPKPKPTAATTTPVQLDPVDDPVLGLEHGYVPEHDPRLFQPRSPEHADEQQHLVFARQQHLVVTRQQQLVVDGQRRVVQRQRLTRVGLGDRAVPQGGTRDQLV